MSKLRYGIATLMLVFLCAYFTGIAKAGEVFYDAGIEVEYVEQLIDVEEQQNDIDSNNTVVNPYFAVVYNARDANLFIRADHTRISRKLENEKVENNYTEYNYSGDYSLVKNLLVLSARGAQGFRSPLIESFNVDDFLLNTDRLNKTTFNQIAADLNLPRNDYLGLEIASSFSNQSIKANEQNIDSDFFNDLSNDTYNLTFSLISGEGLKNVRSNLQASINYSKRERNPDFLGQLISWNNDIKLIKQIGLALNATYENNEVKSSEEEIEGLREFYSAGIGLIWQSSPDRSIEIAINRSKSESSIDNVVDEQEKDENTFISFDIDWRFSNRTIMEANISRRFFGDSGTFSFSHSLRKWRSRISYKEDVTTNLQLLSNVDSGLFVCDNGSTDIADCSLTDSIDTQLEPGQVFVPFLTQTFALNDSVVLNRRLSLESAITRRRTTVSLTGSISKQNELETNRDLETERIGANVLFAISAKTNLKLKQIYSQTDGIISDGPLLNATTKESGISLTHRLGQYLSVAIAYRRLDQKGELNRPGNGIEGPFTDNRLTFSVRYNYGNRR